MDGDCWFELDVVSLHSLVQSKVGPIPARSEACLVSGMDSEDDGMDPWDREELGPPEEEQLGPPEEQLGPEEEFQLAAAAAHVEEPTASGREPTASSTTAAAAAPVVAAVLPVLETPGTQRKRRRDVGKIGSVQTALFSV